MGFAVIATDASRRPQGRAVGVTHYHPTRRAGGDRTGDAFRHAGRRGRRWQVASARKTSRRCASAPTSSNVVNDHTNLKRAGQRYKGLCPFHDENTPSFTVDPARNLFHCFGCGEGGDIYTFLMKVGGLEFTEAVEQLARRQGYELHYEEMSAGQRRALGERSRLVEINEAALAFFREQLYADVGAPAREYLKSRGFGREDADYFQLGFAPNTWEALSRHLQDRQFRQADLRKVGVAKANQRGGLRDTFMGRVIFPVRDLNGDVIGFGGRILPDLDYGDFTPPKYLNSPETPLYHKTKVLYGLHEARPEIVRSGRVLICEGYTDVMALHQAGFANAVATCGTAVTAEHFRLLSRYADNVVLAFDSDQAGTAAAERAWELSKEHDLEVSVLVLDDGRDPADLIRDEGVDAMRTAVEDAERVIPFVIRRTLAAHDLTVEEDRVAALKEAVDLLGQVTDAELRRVYARTEVAERLGVSIEFVERTAQRAGVELDRHQGVASIAPRRSSTDRGPVARVAAARAKLEREVLRLVLQEPSLLPDEWFDVTEGDFQHPKARAIFAAVDAAGGAGVDIDTVLDGAPDDEVRTLVRAVALEEAEAMPEEPEVYVRDLVCQVLLPRVDARIAGLKEQLQRMSPAQDGASYRTLNEELAALMTDRRRLRPHPG